MASTRNKEPMTRESNGQSTLKKRALFPGASVNKRDSKRSLQGRLDPSIFAASSKAKSLLDLEADRLAAEALIRKDYVIMPIHGATVRFPFQPYKSQCQMMAKIIQALKNKQNAILESPTGSGKSLALLCASLSWQTYERDRLYQEAEDKRALAQTRGEQRMQEIEAQTTLLAQVAERSRNTVHDASTTDLQQTHNGDQQVPVLPEQKLTAVEDDDFLPDRPASSRSLNSFKRVVIGYEYTGPGAINSDASHSSEPTSGITRSDSRTVTPSKNILSANNTDNSKVSIQVPTIFFGTRTHKQIAQLIKELKHNTDYRPKISILGGRAHYCINSKLAHKQNKDEECRILLEAKACHYADGAVKQILQKSLRHKIWDIEELNRLGQERKACPYFTSRDMAQYADIVFCPYNYLIDPLIRASLNIKLQDNVIILDEAHNTEDICREAATFEIDERSLTVIKDELETLSFKSDCTAMYQPLLHIVTLLKEWIYNNNQHFSVTEFDRYLNFWEGDAIAGFLQQLCMDLPTLILVEGTLKRLQDQRLQVNRDRENTESQLSTFALQQVCGLFMVLRNLLAGPGRCLLDYRLVLIKRIRRATQGRIDHAFAKDDWLYKLAFWCMNPAVTFSMLSVARSVVLTSGTLSPIDSFTSELQASFPVQLEADHVISLNQTWVGVIPTGPAPKSVGLVGTYQNVNTLAFQDAIGEMILRIVSVTPHGCLCFMPSYSMMDKLIERWKTTGIYEQINALKRIFLEPKASVNAQFEEIISQYYKTIDASVVTSKVTTDGCYGGGIFFGVFRGKVSEGIDFTDERARCVICIGIPYPNSKDIQVQFKKTYNDRSRSAQRQLLTGSEWYDIQAFRAINQALGRCIRHKNDWGAIVFLEKRLSEAKYQRGLSKWVRPRICNYPSFENATSSLSAFMDGKKSDNVKIE